MLLEHQSWACTIQRAAPVSLQKNRQCQSYLQIGCGAEFLVIEEIFRFLLGFDLESFRSLRICAEDTYKILEFPLTDVVISRVHSMYIPLDCVTFVADHEAARVSLLALLDRS